MEAAPAEQHCIPVDACTAAISQLHGSKLAVHTMTKLFSFVFTFPVIRLMHLLVHLDVATPVAAWFLDQLSCRRCEHDQRGGYDSHGSA